jgi:hypothetical protein
LRCAAGCRSAFNAFATGVPPIRQGTNHAFGQKDDKYHQQNAVNWQRDAGTIEADFFADAVRLGANANAPYFA